MCYSVNVIWYSRNRGVTVRVLKNEERLSNPCTMTPGAATLDRADNRLISAMGSVISFRVDVSLISALFHVMQASIWRVV